MRMHRMQCGDMGLKKGKERRGDAGEMVCPEHAKAKEPKAMDIGATLRAAETGVRARKRKGKSVKIKPSTEKCLAAHMYLATNTYIRTDMLVCFYFSIT